ncbi:MAG: hypothetical protein EBV15_10750 [Bacteroidetes bacterium]|nr:hypothetical protein [Bacteroidota bacterium]
MTVNVEEVLVPGAHDNEEPEVDVAVSVILLPSQTDLFEDIETVGAAVTVTVALSEPVQPTEFVPVTV